MKLVQFQVLSTFAPAILCQRGKAASLEWLGGGGGVCCNVLNFSFSYTEEFPGIFLVLFLQVFFSWLVKLKVLLPRGATNLRVKPFELCPFRVKPRQRPCHTQFFKGLNSKRILRFKLFELSPARRIGLNSGIFNYLIALSQAPTFERCKRAKEIRTN